MEKKLSQFVSLFVYRKVLVPSLRLEDKNNVTTTDKVLKVLKMNNSQLPNFVMAAMDPSTPWPGYHNRGAAGQLLDDGDAAVVVVLRTSVVSSRLGSVERDFVFNGGVLQTGCYRWYWPQFVINICSHYRVMALVTEAVLDDKAFPACGCGRVGCPHCASPVYFMSEAKIPPGKYYINTSGTSPYSLHRSRPASLEV